MGIVWKPRRQAVRVGLGNGLGLGNGFYLYQASPAGGFLNIK